MTDLLDAIRERASKATASEVMDMNLALLDLWHELHALIAEKAEEEAE